MNLTEEEKNILRRELRKIDKTNLRLLCYRLCPEYLENTYKLEKENYIAGLMTYGLQNPKFPNYLPCPEEF